MKKKILVTGANGFIGSHLSEALVKKGYSVRAFVHYNSQNSWGWLEHAELPVKKSLDVFSGDIRDPYGVKKAMQGCDVVMHLAALIGIPYSYHSPGTYVETNIGGTLNVLQAAKELNITRLIHTSTSEVYGTAQSIPIKEDHPLCGQSPYAATKIGADQMAMSFYYSFNLPVVIMRPFNTYGPRQSARAVIPSIITQIAADKKEIELGALKPTRDFNYVQDTVAGFIQSINAKKAIGEVINLGSGYEISIKDLALLIGELMNKKITLKALKHRTRPAKSEVNRLCASNDKAKILLGWKPKYVDKAGLKKGLRETIEWMSQPTNLYGYKTDMYNI